MAKHPVPTASAARRKATAVTTERRLFESVSNWRPEAPPDLSRVDEVALDWETTGLDWWDKAVGVGVAVAWYEGDTLRSQYLPIRHAGGNLPEETVHRWLRTELRFKRIYNLGMKFDAHISYKEGVDLENVALSIADVGGYAALLDDHRREFSLEALSQAFLKEGKVQGLQIERMADYHAGEAAPYATRDAELALRLKHHFWPLLGAEDLHRVRELEENVLWPVLEMERNGAVLDRELLKRWTIEVERKYLRLLDEVYKETGLRPEIDSPRFWTDLFRKLDIQPLAWTPQGRPSFTDEVLSKVKHPIVQKARRAGKLADLRKNYFLKYTNGLRPDGLLGYALHPLRAEKGGTVTGRFSCTGLADGVGANIQQVTAVKKQIKKHGNEYIIRELFVPGSGLFLAADAKQIEYRLFAHYAKAPKILARYAENPDTDFHNLVMEMVQRVKPDIDRDRTKDLNFAKIYGAGLKKIAVMLGFRFSDAPYESEEGLAEARPFVRAYDTEFPEAEQLLKNVAEMAGRRGYVRTITGRRARFPNGQFLHAALNRVIQGSAADINKQKLVELHEARKSTGFKLRMTVHDEVAGDVPDLEAAKRVRQILDRQNTFVGMDGKPFSLRVPILWDVGVGVNWANAKAPKETDTVQRLDDIRAGMGGHTPEASPSQQGWNR